MAETTQLIGAREAVASDLRQFFKSTVQAYAGVSITVDAARDFAPDKFTIRDWYVQLTDAYAGGNPTISGQSAFASVFVYSIPGDPIQVGDVVRIDNEMELVTAVDTVTNTATVIRGYSGTTAAAHGAGAAVTRVSGPWRPVVSFDPATGVITINRALSPGPVAGDPIALYGMMEPPAWTDVVNEALASLTFRDRYTTPLLADTWEYGLPTWVMTKDQVEAVRLRYAPAGQRPQEYPVQHIPQDAANTVTIQIASLPTPAGDYSLLVLARHHFAALTQDSATTTCPLKMLRAVAAEKAAERILHQLGEGAREAFGVSMSVIRNRANEARKALLGLSSQMDYSVGHTAPMGPVPVTSGWDWS